MVKMLKPRVRIADTRIAKPQLKTAAPIYGTAEFREWREHVVARAGRRCEATMPDGSRCTKAEPYNRMFADHKIELSDGGAPFDPDNGACLCGAHHTAKTIAVRRARDAASH